MPTAGWYPLPVTFLPLFSQLASQPSPKGINHAPVTPLASPSASPLISPTSPSQVSQPNQVPQMMPFNFCQEPLNFIVCNQGTSPVIFTLLPFNRTRSNKPQRSQKPSPKPLTYSSPPGSTEAFRRRKPVNIKKACCRYLHWFIIWGA